MATLLAAIPISPRAVHRLSGLREQCGVNVTTKAVLALELGRLRVDDRQFMTFI